MVDNIKIIGKRIIHNKASEEYIHVEFIYGKKILDIFVPVVYKRTNTYIPEGEEEKYLLKVYDLLHPKNLPSWKKDQDIFWSEEKEKAIVTKEFFDILSNKIKWNCVTCSLPKNSNPARRIQNLKDLGYTISTNNMMCKKCGKLKYHYMLLPLPRYGIDGNKYENLSPNLIKRIINELNNIDAYEGKKTKYLLPDHKFPEIRWDENTKTINDNDMSSEEIKNKFQLLSNQKNEEKREVCRKCFQTGKRGIIFGIPFFYSGGNEWDENIPKIGKDAELGCVGCPWYDINKWREKIIYILNNYKSNKED